MAPRLPALAACVLLAIWAVALAGAPGAAQPVTFTDVTLPAMTGPDWGEGVAWADYDRDGDLDLLVSNEGQHLQLFKNQGGVLALATPAGLGAENGNWTGIAWGDFDNDGDLDLYAAEAERPKHLFRNDGGDVFTDVTAGALVDSAHTHGVSWSDFDLDGDLDLFYANAFDGDRLLRNDGGGVFADVTPPVLDDPQYGRGVAWCDYDGDGDFDLCVANYGTTHLFRNDGGSFTDVSAPPITDFGHAGGVLWGDYDNDGDFDLLLAKGFSASNRLYRNDGGTFTDVTTPAISADGDFFSAAWGDFDNDGDLDAFLGNYTGPNFLLRNDGGGTFTDVTTPVFADTSVTIGIGWGDYDGDGDLDLFWANNEGQPDHLLRNDADNGNHWLELDLFGTVSNRAAIGARVDLVAGGVRQVRQVEGGGGYNSQGDMRLHFGLGAATTVDTLRVRWPSGIVQNVGPVPIDTLLSIVEQMPVAVEPPAGTPALRLFGPAPNPSAGSAALRFDLAAAAPIRIEVLDPQGRLVRALLTGARLAAGRHEIVWDGGDDAGRRVAPGVYLVRLAVGAATRTVRLVRFE